MHEHKPDPAHTTTFRYPDRATQTMERCECGATRIIDHRPTGDRASTWNVPAAAGGEPLTGR